MSKALTGSEKFRALLFTAAFVLLSLLAFAYVLFSIQQHFFVVQSTTAVVSAETSGLTASRNGEVEMLVKAGDKLTKGQPIATISSPLLTDVSTVASAANMDPADLDKLLERTITSTVTSPCDCSVLNTTVATGQFIVQGQPLLSLSGANTQSQVLARFNYIDVEQLVVGTSVTIDMVDGNPAVQGKITALSIPENIRLEEHKVHSVLVTIEPDTALPLSLANHPVVVKVGDFVL